MTPLRSPLTEDQLTAWFWRLGALHGELLDLGLAPAERVRLGGLAMSITPALATATAAALADAPPLFPDAPLSAAALSAAARAAFGWQLLRDRLQAMARLAADACLVSQTGLTGALLPFLKRSMAGSHPPALAAVEVARRNLALAPAFLLIHSYYKAREKVRARGTAARAAARAAALRPPPPAAATAFPADAPPPARAADPLAERPAEAPPSTAGRPAAARAAARQGRDRTFSGVLRARRPPAAQPVPDREFPARILR